MRYGSVQGFSNGRNSRRCMTPTTRIRTRAQNPLLEFFEMAKWLCTRFYILDCLGYLYDALHKQCPEEKIGISK